MKAFSYLAALGLGTAVTLGNAAPPAIAQVESAEPETPQAQAKEPVKASAQIAASAIALVPQTLPQPEAEPIQLSLSPRAIAAAPEAFAPEAFAAEEAGIPLEVVEQRSPEGSTGVEAVEMSDFEALAAEPSAAQPVAPGPAAKDAAPAAPVEPGKTDPVEQEFINEGNNPTPTNSGSPSSTADPNGAAPAPVEAPNDALGTKEAAPAPTEQTAPISATSLIDQQPNLLRPTDSSEVSIETNEPISLEQAIETARLNSPSIRIRQLQVEQQQAAVDQARAAYSPQFSVNSSFDNSGTVTDTNELYREPNLGQNNDSISRDATVSLSGSARVDYNIIAPDRKARVDAAEIAAEQAKLTLEQDLAALRLDVSQAYYQLQNADEQVKISEQAVVSAQRSLKDAQALEKAGVGTRFSVLQADVQLANEQQNLVNNLSSQQKSRRQLAQILSTPEKLNLTAADPVASAGSWNMTLEQSIVEAYSNRVELDNQLLQRDLSDAQRKIALSSLRPTLSAFAQAGPGLRWDFNRTSPDDADDTKSGVYRGNLGYQAGLRFQWLFGDGGATKSAARQQELNKAIAEENFESARDQVRREVEDAFYDLAANLRNIGTSEQGVIQAEEALRLARLRFQAGVGTQTEVVDAERDLTTARGNRVTAVLNYNRALVQIQRAIGETLPAPAYESPVYVGGEG